MARVLPPRVHLPSGLVVLIDEAAARRAASARSKKLGPLMTHRAVLTGDGVLTGEDGAPLRFDDLALRDAHVLRACVAHAAIVDEEVADFSCESCGAAFAVAPSTELELGPFVDGELDDPELDRPFDFKQSYPVAPMRAGAHAARDVRLAPRSVGEALPLWRAEGLRTLRITPAIVSAMGVVALGRERRVTALAEALSRAPASAFDDVVAAFHEAHYPPRLFAVHLCAACGARNDLDVPLDRELPRGATSSREAAGEAFPSLDTFEALVREIADEIYAARGVRNIGLFIDAGPPACDDGGEPLLGSYTEGAAEGDLGVPEAPEIRLYFRTFRAMYREDGPYDVPGEIRETIDHEVTHHLNHLRGTDPLDDEERDAIDHERQRRVGKRELTLRARRGLVADLQGFVRVAWPVLVLVAAAFVIAWCDSAGGP